METTNTPIDEQYKWDRKNLYPSTEVQLDMLYWDMKNGTTKWVDLVTEIKTKFPKGE